MGPLQGPVICPTIHAKQVGARYLPVNSPMVKTRLIRSEFWGLQRICSARTKAGSLSRPLRARKCTIVQCSFSSSSNDNGSKAENFNENDEDYVNSSIVEAVEVKSGADGFMIKMRDGRHLRCVHNNPQGGHLPDYAPHPAIVLKMEDGTGLLLPIIVLEMPSALLMAAVRNVQIARPTMYQVVKEMVDKMGYEVKLVRVTKRVHEAYFAQLYLTKVDDETESISFDLRPSDAINIAVRCKVPIQVNKYLAYSDGMRIVESGKLLTPASDGLLFTELDRVNHYFEDSLGHVWGQARSKLDEEESTNYMSGVGERSPMEIVTEILSQMNEKLKEMDEKLQKTNERLSKVENDQGTKHIEQKSDIKMIEDKVEKVQNVTDDGEQREIGAEQVMTFDAKEMSDVKDMISVELKEMKAMVKMLKGDNQGEIGGKKATTFDAKEKSETNVESENMVREMQGSKSEYLPLKSEMSNLDKFHGTDNSSAQVHMTSKEDLSSTLKDLVTKKRKPNESLADFFKRQMETNAVVPIEKQGLKIHRKKTMWMAANRRAPIPLRHDSIDFDSDSEDDLDLETIIEDGLLDLNE